MPGMTDVHVHLTQTQRRALVRGLHQEIFGPLCGDARPRPMRWKWRAAASPPCATSAATRAPVIAVRDAVAEGRFPGPADQGFRARRCRSSAAMPMPRPAFRPSSPRRSTRRTSTPRSAPASRNARRSSAELAAAGVDVIKIMATGGVLDPGRDGPRAAFHRRRDEGHRRHGAFAMHLKVAAHAHGARGILAATSAGVDSIEHGTFIDDAGRHGHEGARHLLRRDPDGVQRGPAGCSAPAS